jgi:anti-sigma B factor antagonist
MGAEHDAARNRNSLPRLTLSVRSQNGYAIAEVGGDLDIACAPALREQLLGVLGPHASRIVVDLSGVTFCDASGLAVLIGARRRAWLLGGVLRLAAPAPAVAAVLGLTGLDVQFEIFATVPAATSAPARPRVPDASLHRQPPGGRLSAPPAGPGGPCGGRQPPMMTRCARLSPPCSPRRTRGATPIPTASSPAPFARWPARTPAQLWVPAVHLIPGHPRERHPRLHRAPDHLPG